MSIKYKILVSGLSAILLSGCTDFLDKSPDNRTELSSSEQIAELLVDGYSTGNYSMLCELSSDNFLDNNAPDENGFHYDLTSGDPMQDEAFAWKDVVSGDDTDSPSYIWTGCYRSIAIANHALAAINKLDSQGYNEKISALRGEALLIRAYNHFILINIFAQAYKDENLSKNDAGIPYVTTVADKVFVHQARESVADVYKKIEEDLSEGIDLIRDNIYSVPRYHFNRQAANAFAARFFLYKREYQKVIKHANAALGEGDEAAGKLRDWMRYEGKSTSESRRNEWSTIEQFNNFLLIPTNSPFSRIFGTRYGCTREAGKGTIYGEGPTWNGYNFHPCYQIAGLFYRGNQEYGYFLPKVIEYFEYSDKIAGIGYTHILRCEFTAEETLLCRAEAEVYLKNYTRALADLKMWDDSRQKLPGTFEGFKELTFPVIKSFYTDAKTLFVKELNNTQMSPQFVIEDPENQVPYIRCILHFRRLETMFDGLRWFDVKRYGIEINRKIGIYEVQLLKWNDPRRALQLPAEVIAAGMTPNNRLETSQVPPSFMVGPVEKINN